MSKETVHTEKIKNLTIEIYTDYDAESPDAYGDDGLFLVGYHRDFTVKRDKIVTKDECIAALDPKYSGSVVNDDGLVSAGADLRAKYHVFPLEAYIHGGVSLYLSGGATIDRQWDVSQLGAVFVSRTEWPDADKARKAALSLIQEWNDVLSGNVYGYIVRDERGNDLDSCWGFIGDYDADGGILSEARAIAKNRNTPAAIKARKAKYKADDIAQAEKLLAPYKMGVK